MDTGWLHPVVTASGPFASVHVDVSRAEAASGRELEVRWAGISDRLLSQGAPKELVSSIEDRVMEPTGRAGEQGRSIVATPDAALLDRVLPRAPLRSSGTYGLVPHLMPAVRATAHTVPYGLVEVDHRGADVTLVGAFGDLDTREVEGGHDVLHKFGGGGWSHRRYQMRVEDSWERNATAVAEELDRVVGQHRPRLLVLTGDPHARSYVREHASGRVADLLVDVEGGGRADGVDREAVAERVDDVVRAHVQSRMGDVVARFEQEIGRGGAAVQGLPAVVDALRGGSVEVLLLHDDPSSTEQLWAGSEPLQLGTTADEVLALGADDVVRDRADAILLRALVAQSGAVELVEGVESLKSLKSGIGALLRFDVRPPVPGRG
jgi:hypothetical protein